VNDMKKTTLKEYESRLKWLEEMVVYTETAFRENVKQVEYSMGKDGGGMDNIHLGRHLRYLNNLFRQYSTMKYAVEFMKTGRVI